MINTPQRRSCDVHRLVDFDCEQRQCVFCPLCQAWICEECSGNWIKRLKAAWLRRDEPGYAGRQDYPELLRKQIEEKE